MNPKKLINPFKSYKPYKPYKPQIQQLPFHGLPASARTRASLAQSRRLRAKPHSLGSEAQPQTPGRIQKVDALMGCSHKEPLVV